MKTLQCIRLMFLVSTASVVVVSADQYPFAPSGIVNKREIVQGHVVDTLVDRQAAATAHLPVQTEAKYFQDIFSVQLAPYKIEFGHVCENPDEWEQRYEKKDLAKHHHQGKVRWGDKEGGYGEHYWDYNHAGHGGGDHDNYSYDNDGHGSADNAEYQAYDDGAANRAKRQPENVQLADLDLVLDDKTGYFYDKKTGQSYIFKSVN